MINDRGGLAIATLIFYVLAILASLLLCRKHGFGRNGGWIFLMIFSLIRVAGSIAELVAVNDPSVASVTAATALAGSGFSALLMAEIGVLQRLNEGIPAAVGRIPPIVFRVTVLSLIVGLALGINGGVQQASSSQNQGQTYSHVAGILYGVAFVIMSLEALFTGLRIRYIIHGEQKLLMAIAAAFPFLVVRLVYTEFVYFEFMSGTFNAITGSVVVEAFVSYFPEYVVMLLFLVAGWFTPRIERHQIHSVEDGYNNTGSKYGNQTSGRIEHA